MSTETAAEALAELAEEGIADDPSATTGALFGLVKIEILKGEPVIKTFVRQLCTRLVVDSFTDHLMQRICVENGRELEQVVDVPALDVNVLLASKLASVREQALCEVIRGADPDQVFSRSTELRSLYDAQRWRKFLAARAGHSRTVTLLMFHACPHYVRTTDKAAPWYFSRYRRKYLYQLLINHVESVPASERERWISHYDNLYGVSKFLLVKGVHSSDLPLVRGVISQVSSGDGKILAQRGLATLNQVLREVESRGELRMIVGLKAQIAETYGVAPEKLVHGRFLPVVKADQEPNGQPEYIYTLTAEAEPLAPPNHRIYTNLTRGPIRDIALKSLVEKYYPLVAEEFTPWEAIPMPTFDQVLASVYVWRSPMERFGNVSLPEVHERAPEKR